MGACVSVCKASKNKNDNKVITANDKEQSEKGVKIKRKQTKFPGKVKDDDDEDNSNNANKKEKLQTPEELQKFDDLIKMINKTIESVGYSQEEVKEKLDEIYDNLEESITQEALVDKLSELLFSLMEVSLDSDKNEIKDCLKEIIIFYNNNKKKIKEQLMVYINRIGDQDKLTTALLNAKIQDDLLEYKDKLNKRLKKENIPSDKIITYELFKKIIEEEEIKIKDHFMEILLYQMKSSVPKEKSFHSLNLNILINFIK
jgi:hypothetical protein